MTDSAAVTSRQEDAVDGLLAGRTAVVTGAAAGVGRGIAVALAAAGASVVVTARRGEAAREVVDAITAAGGTAAAEVCDVTSAPAVDAALGAAVRRFGRLDAVVHNATSRRSSEPVDLERAPVALWDEHAAVASVASYTIARAAHGHLRDTAGSYVLLTSPAGVQGSANLAFYAAAKGAQRGFVKSLAREWGPDGIRVNALAPLAVTPALDNAMRLDPGLEDRVTALIPMGRIGDPVADIGPCAVFLCGSASRYVTGQTLIVSGGRMTAL
ncbi:SDR family oxidoreductase [Yinghuangia sp. ASG 101]|uniref:SDR family NAD(P)-dependent oxidoreductase n=1 Tax=Yinghuangia sp. ASG 101 TaxID=2896848 RepID=UPI001E43363B|nr:SDR family oxidoreductase [Yinghuangia sp. ASG 101]UGQ14318.1 SDR family oxidoreductase [Yinghuangia sp. ASG 101]